MQTNKQSLQRCPRCGDLTLNITIDGVCRTCYKSKPRRPQPRKGRRLNTQVFDRRRR